MRRGLGTTIILLEMFNKHQRRTGSLAGVESQTPMGFPSRGSPFTLPDTGIDPCDDVARVAAPRGTGDILVHQVASVMAGVPVEDHKKFLLHVKDLQEALGKTKSAMDAMQARI